MGVRISDLPASAGANLAMQFEVNNAGTSERLTLAQMFALSTGAIVADTPLLNMAQTWNNAGVTFTGWKLNVTDTASAVGSMFFDFQLAGNSVLKLTKAGALTLSSGVLFIGTGGQLIALSEYGIDVVGNAINRVNSIAFSDMGAGSSAEFSLIRDAANTLAQRNGTNEQVFRIYGTYTDASNNNYLQVAHQESIGYCSIFSKANGSANLRPLRFGIGNNSIFQITTAGHLEFLTDNTYDIGANGGNRPRDINAGQNITAGNLYKIGWTGIGGVVGVSDGVFWLQNNAANSFDRLQFGGTTNAFPALKRNSAAIEARLADDSAYATLRGKITTEAAAATETITPDKTLTLYDVNGTAYKVPCVTA